MYILPEIESNFSLYAGPHFYVNISDKGDITEYFPTSQRPCDDNVDGGGLDVVVDAGVMATWKNFQPQAGYTYCFTNTVQMEAFRKALSREIFSISIGYNFR